MNLALLVERVHQDVRYGVRTLLHQPMFAVCAIATLALGIGANTAIFTLVNSVVLKPLAYHDPDSLVSVSGGATFPRYEFIKAAKSFSAVGAANVFTGDVAFSSSDEVPESLKSVRVSANFLTVLQVPPLAGRSFVQTEETDGSCTAMISEPLSMRRFGKPSSALGAAVRIGGQPCIIVGVLPRSFVFPFPDVDIWAPLQPAAVPLQARINSPGLSVFARLKPGVPLQQASEEMRIVNQQYALAHPGALDAKSDRPEHLVVLKDKLVRDVRQVLWMLMGAVGLLLAIACANIAGLFLVRARLRSREVAVRMALGASRLRLARQLVTESLILALTGGALGIALAAMAVRWIDRIPGLELPRATEIHLDGNVLVFATLLSITTGVLFGLAPSRLGFRASFIDVLRGGDEVPESQRQNGWTWFATSSRNLLVILQVALSTVLLIGAVLLIVSVARLRLVDLGFDAQNLLTMRLVLSRPAGTIPGTGPNFDELIRRVESVPGVRSAAVTMTLPATGFAGTPVWPVNAAPPALNKRPIAILQAVTPGYFRTMGIAVRSGRDFAVWDSSTSTKVAVINEALAKRFWPGYPRENPIGQPILAGASPDPLEIVGVVSDVRQAGIADSAEPGIYRPRSQLPVSAMFAIRTIGDPLRIVNAVRSEIASIDRNISITAVKTMNDVLGDSEGRRRGITLLLGLFAATGLLLTCVGIYGVIAYSVATRTREFGIRKALGAQQIDVLRLVLGQGLKLAIAGAALGLCGGAALTGLLQSFLFEIKAIDPAVFAGVALLGIAVSLAAGYLPARHAMRIEPAVAFRRHRS